MMINSMIEVFIKVNENNEITDINSSIFLADVMGWIQIDSGNGDKYAHAQGNYLEKPIRDEYGRYNYKFIDDVVVEISEEEKPVIEIVVQPTAEERLNALELELNILLGMEV